ncbi:hypothetical protein AB0K09_33560, partial [Streptomyces sp. NPDC049577]|uniref:hypothetical protein n=1 Tax=Streptomyces sp. NPDC049577 TaxID=3155153 RepID=UPI00342CC3CF
AAGMVGDVRHHGPTVHRRAGQDPLDPAGPGSASRDNAPGKTLPESGVPENHGERTDDMVFLVAALFLLGVLSGTAAHIPVSLTLLSAAVICVWLGVFAVRERRTARRRDRRP